MQEHLNLMKSFILNNNENAEMILNDLYGDYGDLFARLIEFQMRKSQVRSIVKLIVSGLVIKRKWKGK